MGLMNMPEKKCVPLNKNTLHNQPVRIANAFTKSTISNLGKSNQVNHSPNQITHDSNQSNSYKPKQKVRNFGSGQILSKGQKVSLSGINNITVCAGWDVKNPNCDVDISAFMLDASRKIISDDWFVFYGQDTSPDGSLKLNCEGTSVDDKCINVNLSSINKNVSRIVFVLTIDEAELKHLNFSMICNAYIRILNGNNEIFRFMLSDYYDTITSMMLGELYLHNGTWKFTAIGDGVKKDLAGLCEMYGVETE